MFQVFFFFFCCESPRGVREADLVSYKGCEAVGLQAVVGR